MIYFVRVTFVFLVFMLLSNQECFAQLGKKSVGPKSDNFARWVFRPAIYPYYPISSGYFDDQGRETITVEGHGIENIIRFSRYEPGGGVEFGFDLGFSQRFDVFRHRLASPLSSALYEEGSIIFGPTVGFSLRDLSKVNHPKLTMGLSWRYAINRNLRYNTTTAGSPSGSALNFDLPFFKRSSGYLQFGVGNLKERFSLTRRQVRPSELNVMVFVPLFNQAQQVVRDSTRLNSSPLGTEFAGLNRRNIHFGLMYTELIDRNRNGKRLDYNELDPIRPNSKGARLLQPLISRAAPWKRVEGVLSFLTIYQPSVTKLDSNLITGEETILRPSIGWRFAYSCHIGFNRNSYFGSNNNGKLNGSSILIGAFATGGIQQQIYRFESSLRYRSVLQTSAFGEAGFRVGGTRGLMLFSGAGYQSSLSLISIHQESLEERLSNLTDIYYFGGLLVGDTLVIRIQTANLNILREQNGSLLERLVLGVGVGF